ncbi:MAG: glutamine--tRNA ligase/YqeY domain fusion protein [Candidatus Promineofilum sp.]|nr:glutamine--tRNA ligase/YqeY domain fusion protein [Promineifilum sp.]MBP9657775.1 glutamine--tRNA ligase/YqeY domain fusion protein [Promineifilum sp.]
MTDTTTPTTSNFIRTIIDEDNAIGKHAGRVHTRFPPEPNGYLHIGHAKSINLNYGLARDYNGLFNLRFDDTNPEKEEQEYIDAIMEDVRWLGADWDGRLFHASDYFEQLYQWAEQLIRDGKAYVDDLSAEEIREHRGTLTEAGRNSPYRDRAVEENLDLFRRMRAGEYPEGSRVLRAKIDMTSAFIVLRDPVMYRILHAPHPRTGNAWHIYPTYDWAHGQSDSIEGITHSICTLEFENNRRLYDWFQEALGIPRSQQIEFARLNLTYTVMSKRKMIRLVKEGHVNGWDDPRMWTIRGLRRRGYTAEGIRNFTDMIGVSKANSLVDMSVLEHAVREDLNIRTPRVMAVLEPLKVVIENYPAGQEETFDVTYYKQDKTRTESRPIPFSHEIYIERDDFMEEPVKGYNRLAPGVEVRLMNAYYITCTGVVKDKAGRIVELRATYDPASRGGQTADGRKVKGTIHWVSAEHALPAEARLFEPLFTQANPEEGVDDFVENLNPDSLRVADALVEPSLATAAPGDKFQFVRNGYFCIDPDTTGDMLVINRTVGLREGWR